jgi:hypothetical protein
MLQRTKVSMSPREWRPKTIESSGFNFRGECSAANDLSAVPNYFPVKDRKVDTAHLQRGFIVYELQLSGDDYWRRFAPGVVADPANAGRVEDKRLELLGHITTDLSR